jgi:hypothetical protein
MDVDLIEPVKKPITVIIPPSGRSVPGGTIPPSGRSVPGRTPAPKKVPSPAPKKTPVAKRLPSKTKKSPQLATTPSFPVFEDLTPTTVAAVVYFNATIDFEKIYRQVRVVPVDPRIDTLKKRDKKLSLATSEKGLLLTVRYLDHLRGYPKVSGKKVWCGKCQLMTMRGENQVKVNTAIGRHFPLEGDDPSRRDESQIKFWCGNCKGTYSAKEMGFLDHFKNQLMIDVTTGHNTVNIMIFQGKMKIAGCNSELEPVTLAGFIWHNYIQPIEGAWTLNPSETRLKMAMHTIMCNINFSFGMDVDADLLMGVWGSPEYEDEVMEVKASNPAQKNVKIRFVYDPASDEGVGYQLLTFIDGARVTLKKVDEIPFPYTKKPGKVAKTTAIVFMSSATILSGRNMLVNKSRFEFFRSVVEANAGRIREACQEVDKVAIRALLT